MSHAPRAEKLHAAIKKFMEELDIKDAPDNRIILLNAAYDTLAGEDEKRSLMAIAANIEARRLISQDL